MTAEPLLPPPLSVEKAAGNRISRSEISSDGSWTYWLEPRLQEKGRVVLMRARVGVSSGVVSPNGVSMRSRVHEYGGGAYCLLKHPAPDDVQVAYVDESDQYVYVSALSEVDRGSDHARPNVSVRLGASARVGERWVHGGLSATADGRFVLAVRERHLEGSQVERSIVWMDAVTPGVEGTLCSGHDFFGVARSNPSGSWLAWVCWEHPNMPWDGSELWVGSLQAASEGLCVQNALLLDGGEDVSVSQPMWANEDELLYMSDRDGWWQPWMAKTRSFARTREKSRRVCDLRADFQGPDWVLGQTTMAALGDGRIGCTWKEGGIDRIGVLEIVSGSLVELEQSCVAVSSLCTHAGGMAWLGQTAYSPVEVWWAEPESLGGDEEGQVRLSGRAAKVFEVGDVGLDPAEISVARGISFVAPSGRNVHALLYEPFGESDASKGSPPPLVVMCHGGPTSSAGAGLDLFVQLLTTRGFAVAAINYAGSSGYGRAVRRSLDGLWGVADVDDCVDAVRYLASQGLVDVTKIAIRGSSAGGLTALNALVRSDLFAAAVSWYGVTDLVGLASMTHDFESRYTDRLVGPLPDALDSYHERSPLYRVDDMSGSVLLLQGSDDPVVPASQAESMAKALRERGLRCELLVFEGESHGFRRVETLIACMEAEIAFYQEVFGW